MSGFFVALDFNFASRIGNTINLLYITLITKHVKNKANALVCRFKNFVNFDYQNQLAK